MMNIYLFHEAHDQVTGTLDSARQELLQLMQAMREYFVPARFYSRYYPYTNFRTAMVRGVGVQGMGRACDGSPRFQRCRGSRRSNPFPFL